MTVSETLRETLRADGRNMLQLSKLAGLTHDLLYEFVRSDSNGLRTGTLDKICEVLGLELRPRELTEAETAQKSFVEQITEDT